MMKKSAFLLVILFSLALVSNAFAATHTKPASPPSSAPSMQPAFNIIPSGYGPAPSFPISTSPSVTPSYSAPQKVSNSFYYGSLGSRTLKRTYPCMRGSDIRTLQTMLNALGFRCGRADGVFGDRTKSAVMAFQRANGLKVDGIVGRATKARLLSRYRGRR